nr:hypothetical protein CFP56_48746 [Quercus suber]
MLAQALATLSCSARHGRLLIKSSCRETVWPLKAQTNDGMLLVSVIIIFVVSSRVDQISCVVTLLYRADMTGTSNIESSTGTLPRESSWVSHVLATSEKFPDLA